MLGFLYIVFLIQFLERSLFKIFWKLGNEKAKKERVDKSELIRRKEKGKSEEA